VQLTESWLDVFPPSVLDRYAFAETRNAAATLQGAHPDLLAEIIFVLEAFHFDVERIVRPGGSKHLIPVELDEAFRVLGWREASFEQELTTHLHKRAYRPAGEGQTTVESSTVGYAGHLIDNVKGRVGLDVEWNPKDGNLDRDFGNFRALYDAGVLDVGIILTRREVGMRDLWFGTIARAKELNDAAPMSVAWSKRIDKTPKDPLKTSTTSNFEKLVPRVRRGDAGGCPFLAIAITTACYTPPLDLDDQIRRVAEEHTAGREPERMAQRMNPDLAAADPRDVLSDTDEDDDEDE
jgi:Restriction endonuclease BglII